MKHTARVFCLVLSIALAANAGLSQARRGGQAAPIPSHPREIQYPKLKYDAPDASAYRQVLRNGVVAFMVEDHDLPLVTVSVTIRVGSYLDPQSRIGLSSTVGSQLRAGGTEVRGADEFDEQVDFLAASLSSFVGGASAGASANFLRKDMDQALLLFFEMLRRPTFAPDRLDLYKSRRLQQIERRNDRTDSIEGREWTRLLRGPDHFTTRLSTRSSIESITREDLIAFHRRYYYPRNFIFAVSGDFAPSDMRKRLESAMEGWDSLQETVPAVPSPNYAPVPGVYMVDKPGVNQGRVSLGHLGIRRDNPDSFAVMLMNDVLGGSGFTSRILNRVRSDEGLAYSAGSSFGQGVYYEGIFRAQLQSKSSSAAEAAQIVLDEIDRIRQEGVSAEELETVRNYAIEIFPRFFSSARAIAGTLAMDEFTGRDPDYWKTYRDRLRSVTTDDVSRVARKYLRPEQLVILVVGKVDDLLAADPSKPQYSFSSIADQHGATGGINRIPLPDPTTMIYP